MSNTNTCTFPSHALYLWGMSPALRGSVIWFSPFCTCRGQLKFSKLLCSFCDLLGRLRFIKHNEILYVQITNSRNKSFTHKPRANKQQKSKQTEVWQWKKVTVGVSADHLKSEQGLKEAGKGTKPGVCNPEDITWIKQNTTGPGHGLISILVTKKKKRDNVSSNPYQTHYIWLSAPINVIGWF